MDLLDQRFSFHNINIHRKILDPRFLGIHEDPSDAPVFQTQCIIHILMNTGADQLLRYFLLRVRDRHIRSALNMFLQHGTKIKVNCNVGIRHDHVFFLFAL